MSAPSGARGALAALLGSTALAQTAPTPTAPASTAAMKEAAVILTPSDVHPDKDDGCVASETLAGPRLYPKFEDAGADGGTGTGRGYTVRWRALEPRTLVFSSAFSY